MTIFERYQTAGVTPPPCHLRAKRPRPIPLDDDTGRAFALTDPPRGTVREIVRALDVEQSLRYRPKGGETQCNVYFHDVMHALGVYGPRAWWVDDELERCLDLAQERNEKDLVPPQRALEMNTWDALWGHTANEIRANELLGWLRTWGRMYRWAEFDSVGWLASKATEGMAGVICARNRDPRRSGHVTVVIGAQGFGEAIQSQAGRVCRQEFVGSPDDPKRNWWESSSFADVGFFAAPIPAGGRT